MNTKGKPKGRYFSQRVKVLESGWGDKILQGRVLHSWKWGKYEYNKIISWAGELAQQLGTYAAFVEDHSLIPRTHIGWITTTCNLALRSSTLL